MLKLSNNVRISRCARAFENQLLNRTLDAAPFRLSSNPTTCLSKPAPSLPGCTHKSSFSASLGAPNPTASTARGSHSCCSQEGTSHLTGDQLGSQCFQRDGYTPSPKGAITSEGKGCEPPFSKSPFSNIIWEETVNATTIKQGMPHITNQSRHLPQLYFLLSGREIFMSLSSPNQPKVYEHVHKPSRPSSALPSRAALNMITSASAQSLTCRLPTRLYPGPHVPANPACTAKPAYRRSTDEVLRMPTSHTPHFIQQLNRARTKNNALLTISNTVKQPREQNHRSNRPLLPRPGCYYDGVAIYMRVRRKALVDREPYVRVMRHFFGGNVFAARVVDYNAQPGDVDIYGGHSRGF